MIPESPEHGGAAGVAPYEIQILGELDPRWAACLEGWALAHPSDEEHENLTTLRFPAIDQARLRGILTRLWDLNLTVVSVRRLSPPGGPAGDIQAGPA